MVSQSLRLFENQVHSGNVPEDFAFSAAAILVWTASCRWIPDGQLCPTVPNRSNYIHWIEDLLSSGIIPKSNNDGPDAKVRGFDIGTGANCIYPLLGASLLGWSFVATGVSSPLSLYEIMFYPESRRNGFIWFPAATLSSQMLRTWLWNGLEKMCRTIPIFLI